MPASRETKRKKRSGMLFAVDEARASRVWVRRSAKCSETRREKEHVTRGKVNLDVFTPGVSVCIPASSEGGCWNILSFVWREAVPARSSAVSRVCRDAQTFLTIQRERGADGGRWISVFARFSEKGSSFQRSTFLFTSLGMSLSESTRGMPLHHVLTHIYVYVLTSRKNAEHNLSSADTSTRIFYCRISRFHYSIEQYLYNLPRLHYHKFMYSLRVRSVRSASNASRLLRSTGGAIFLILTGSDPCSK